MKATRLAAISAMVVLNMAAAGAFQVQTWPSGVQKVSNDSPVLSPEAELKTFVLPPGYRAELVASEPMIDHPMLIEWDADGRMWLGVHAECLAPIDDYDGNELTTWSACIWQPKEIRV